MNNVLKDSLFVSQNRKFDEIQSVEVTDVRRLM